MVLAEVDLQGRVELFQHRTNRAEYSGPLYGCPGHVCATHSAGYLKFATAAGAMALHGHGGNAVVTVTRGG